MPISLVQTKTNQRSEKGSWWVAAQQGRFLPMLEHFRAELARHTVLNSAGQHQPLMLTSRLSH